MRITIHLNEPETKGLLNLSEIELRSPREQVLLILRTELERRGLLDASRANGKEPASDQPAR